MKVTIDLPDRFEDIDETYAREALVATLFGNAGNGSEPHLHIHATRAGGGAPLTFNGRFCAAGMERVDSANREWRRGWGTLRRRTISTNPRNGVGLSNGGGEPLAGCPRGRQGNQREERANILGPT